MRKRWPLESRPSKPCPRKRFTVRGTDLAGGSSRLTSLVS